MRFVIEENEVYLEDENKNVIAKACFEKLEQDTYNISRVFVEEKFRGQNIASEIMKCTTKELQSRGARKICATCSYAAHWLEKNNT